MTVEAEREKERHWEREGGTEREREKWSEREGKGERERLADTATGLIHIST